jgi:RHS repeat-associated protein
MRYSYDNASQLTGITYKDGGTTLGTLTYAYDLAGRRTQMGGSYAQIGLPLAINEAEYNANNQLTEWGTASLYYDPNGNMTSDGTNSYVWNPRNQLASMDSSAYSFQYDGYGRRTGKTISGATTNYLYDGATSVQELSGSTVIANLLTGLGVDERFTRTDSSGTANFLTDALGSTLALTNSSGSSLAQYAYEPFGNTTVTSGSSTSTYEYTGRENDGTGLYFNRARYYSPTLQRFVSEDPLGFGGGDANLYAYVGNSPTSSTDSSGMARDCFASWCGGVPRNPLPGRKSGAQSSSDVPPSWSPDKPLPGDPTGLGPDWSRDTRHLAPNDERWVNDKTGDKIDYHPAIPGEPGEMGKDHWHWVPGGEKEDEHYSPGDVIKQYGPAVIVGVGIAGVVHVIIQAAPVWVPLLAF